MRYLPVCGGRRLPSAVFRRGRSVPWFRIASLCRLVASRRTAPACRAVPWFGAVLSFRPLPLLRTGKSRGGGRDEDRRMYMAGGPNGGRLGCRGGDGAQRAVRLVPWAEYLRGRTGHEKLLHALRRAEVSVRILFYFCWSISRALISRKTSVFSITPLKLYAPAP